MNDQELIERAQGRIRDLHELQAKGLITWDGEFFPSVHYPPITMYDTIDEDGLLGTYTPPRGDKFSLYVHIPFCNNRCVFCHYPVKVGASEQEKSFYLQMLFKEMDLWKGRLGIEQFKARSVLVAGGTPTALSPAQFRWFHEEFARRVDLTPCTQLAYDVHPKTLLGPEGRERLQVMRDYGSTRLTIGTQSFNDEILGRMRRGHDSRQAIESIEACHQAGFDDVCVEFIFGYPGQTMESWIQTIRTAIETGVEEIQLYRLKVVPYGDEAGAILFHRDKGRDRFLGIDETMLMKQVAILMLQDAGYEETLTRVFSKNPHHFSHYASDQCCKLHDQLGFGLSSFSSLRDRFSITPDSFAEYYALVDAGRVPVNRGLVRTADEQHRWNVILPLKNWKIHKKYYHLKTGQRIEVLFRDLLDDLAAHGLLHEDEKIVRLTPKGRFFADECCHQFHSERYLPFTRDRYAEGPLNPWRVAGRPRLATGS